MNQSSNTTEFTLDWLSAYVPYVFIGGVELLHRAAVRKQRAYYQIKHILDEKNVGTDEYHEGDIEEFVNIKVTTNNFPDWETEYPQLNRSLRPTISVNGRATDSLLGLYWSDVNIQGEDIIIGKSDTQPSVPLHFLITDISWTGSESATGSSCYITRDWLMVDIIRSDVKRYNFELTSSISAAITVSDSYWYNAYLNRSSFLDNPIGVIAVKIVSDSHVLNMDISNTIFTNSTRAIDLSLKGTSTISIHNCSFTNLIGLGSGGALRFTNAKEPGWGQFTKLKHTDITIIHCNFANNFADTHAEYPDSHVYYSSRAPGSGGAIYVFITAASLLPSDGHLIISHSTFVNNTALEQGGTLFIGWGVMADILHCTFSNTLTNIRPKIGGIFHGLSSVNIRHSTFTVMTSDSTTPELYYQASDVESTPLSIENLELNCPSGFLTGNMRSDSRSLSGGLETLQLYCRMCPREEYTLETSTLTITSQMMFILHDSSTCHHCPYGAECNRGRSCVNM